ncbi:hypothetical protein GUITHDRAFT_111218 [Guillardia theta CCMP2712]|uniref:Uncharacterized protein n=1 Tax=Guillardia theta (strain CCMP2712) TaxID=905079 RepID=L1J439_GUITC|nr:hypothetical protein GUITHDRAFT_111218 [Guillardia theta CCMP2712]EKX42850.1 hypothetical protein GUITHDRAFT_111218 [Guillardia theta CCMP2712]|eukprot:XP_005829830.1 hypothetical protein GUITHDRAFT_111218 [Guillardia theta CCMP2712]
MNPEGLAWTPRPDDYWQVKAHDSSINALETVMEGSGEVSVRMMICGSGDEKISIWDAKKQKKIETLQHVHQGYISSLLVVDDMLLSGSFDQTICLWSIERRSLIKQIKAHAHCVNHLFLHESGVVLSASWDSCVRVWDLRTRLQDHGFSSVVKLPDAALCVVGKQTDVYCGLHDCSIAALDLRSSKQRDTFTGHSGYVTSLHLANLELFSTSFDGSVRVTDVRNGKGRAVLETGLASFNVYHRVDGTRRWVTSSHADGGIRITNVVSGEVKMKFETADKEQIFSLIANHHGMLIAGDALGKMHAWGVKREEEEAAVPTMKRPPASSARMKLCATRIQKVRVSPPSFQPAGGALLPSGQVTITCSTPGATILYSQVAKTISLSDMQDSHVVSGPIPVSSLASSSPLVLHARAFDPSSRKGASAVTSTSFELKVRTPSVKEKVAGTSKPARAVGDAKRVGGGFRLTDVSRELSKTQDRSKVKEQVAGEKR